jgi:DNA repair exonuclease SbcCD ATPase subunit
MIKFKRIKWKNLLSTGNEFQEIDFESHHRTMIIGKNGHGKSTLIDALTFGLYGKPFRSVKKDNLINSINKKDLEVHIRFDVGNSKYNIIRGIRPNKFEIYKDSVLINQDAKVRDYQKFLERNILKMNYQAFTQVVVLGSSSYVPFMRLSTSRRREVVEELLDIKIFSLMNLLLKINFRKTLEDHKELSNGFNLLSETIKVNVLSLKSLKSRAKASDDKNNRRLNDNNSKISELNYDIERLESVNSKLHRAIENVSDVQNHSKKLSILHGQLRNKLKSVHKSIDFYSDNDSCPECEQDITRTFKDFMFTTQGNLKNELATALNELSSRLSTTQCKLDNIKSIDSDIVLHESIIKTNNTMIQSLMSNNSEIEKDILADENGNIEIIELKESIKSKKETLTKIEDKLQVTIQDKEYMSVMKNLLSDEGVKASIIKKYVPLINKTINSYLSSMEFHARFELDEEFNESIFSRYIDKFNYDNFSEGEKQRIDLALLFTWRKIAKMKNSGNTNLLIIDEIFDSSLDDNGTEEFMKILNTLENENIFVISHKNHMAERFDEVIKFKKTGNFSRRV